MTLRIPTSTTLSDYSQTTSLEGRDYLLRFLWNQREATWFLSLADSEGAPIVEGVKVVVQTPLLRLVTDPRQPPGILIAVDSQTVDAARSGGAKVIALDPGLSDLGDRVFLLYYTEAEVAALGIGA